MHTDAMTSTYHISLVIRNSEVDGIACKLAGMVARRTYPKRVESMFTRARRTVVPASTC
jgi:hypothetical protein